MSVTRAGKRITAFILALLMLCTMAACSEEGGSIFDDGDEPEIKESHGIIRLAYSREDSLNPFTAKSLMNKTIAPLLYSGLFSLSESYEAEPDIASKVSNEDTDVIVTLDSSRRFSDGSVITADDVVYSFGLAKSSEYYATMLSCVESAVAANTNTVVFKTPVKNVYAASLLTFPIIKQNSDAGDAVPIGAGPYVYTATADGGELTANKRYTKSSYAQDVIILENISDTSTLMHSLVIGNIDAVFDDLSDGESQRINASSIQVDLNNLIFLGINPSGPLSTAEVRSALSAVIDRDKLVSTGLEGYGTTSYLPFNPSWHGASDVKVKSKTSDDKENYIAKAFSGYTLTVLVNSDNTFKVKLAEELCAQLNKMGVSTQLSKATFEVYKQGVASGNYNIYIGEYKLTADMNISQLIPDEELRSMFYETMAGNVSVEEFLKSFNAALPFVPVAFRNGVFAYSRLIENEVVAAPENVFSNLTEWTV